MTSWILPRCKIIDITPTSSRFGNRQSERRRRGYLHFVKWAVVWCKRASHSFCPSYFPSQNMPSQREPVKRKWNFDKHQAVFETSITDQAQGHTQKKSFLISLRPSIDQLNRTVNKLEEKTQRFRLKSRKQWHSRNIYEVTPCSLYKSNSLTH